MDATRPSLGDLGCVYAYSNYHQGRRERFLGIVDWENYKHIEMPASLSLGITCGAGFSKANFFLTDDGVGPLHRRSRVSGRLLGTLLRKCRGLDAIDLI